jgi:hypothetical protein
VAGGAAVLLDQLLAGCHRAAKAAGAARTPESIHRTIIRTGIIALSGICSARNNLCDKSAGAALS